MIYNANKWQSINKTNQESEYLQLCRAKAYYMVQHMFLTEAALLTLLLYKTPSGYCMSFASQVRVTEWIQVRNSRYLYTTSLVYSIMVKFSPRVFVLLWGSFTIWWKSHHDLVSFPQVYLFFMGIFHQDLVTLSPTCQLHFLG